MGNSFIKKSLTCSSRSVCVQTARASILESLLNSIEHSALTWIQLGPEQLTLLSLSHWVVAGEADVAVDPVKVGLVELCRLWKTELSKPHSHGGQEPLDFAECDVVQFLWSQRRKVVQDVLAQCVSEGLPECQGIGRAAVGADAGEQHPQLSWKIDGGRLLKTPGPLSVVLDQV